MADSETPARYDIASGDHSRVALPMGEEEQSPTAAMFLSSAPHKGEEAVMDSESGGLAALSSASVGEEMSSITTPSATSGSEGTATAATRDRGGSAANATAAGTSSHSMAIGEDVATRCPECCKPFRIPRLLDCLHTVCEDCLRARLQPVRWMISCPICGQETRLPAAGFTVIPMNWVSNRRQRQQFSNAAQSGVATGGMPLCEECILEEENVAVSVCIECRVFLCDMHNRAHSRSRFTKSHSVIEQREKLPDAEVEGEFMGAAVMCGVHPHKPILGYCCDCRRTYCINCRNLSHGDHELVEMYVAGDRFRSALRDRYTAVKGDLLPSFQLAVKEIDNTLDNLADRSHEISKHITDWVHKQITQLRLLEKEMLSTVSELRAEREEPLAKRRAELSDIVDKTSQSVQLCEEVLALDNSAEVLEMYTTVDDRMKALEAERAKGGILDLGKFEFMQYAPNAELQKQIGAGIGFVGNQPATPYTSEITGMDDARAVECGRDVLVNIQICAESGQAYEPGCDEDCLRVAVLSPGKQPVAATLAHMGQGLHTVIFKPTVFGKHTLDALLNSVPIRNSPYAITVPLQLVAIDGQRCMKVSNDRRTVECVQLGDCAAAGSVVLRDGRHSWRVVVGLQVSSPLVVAVGVIALSADFAGCKVYQAHSWRSDAVRTQPDGELCTSALGRWLSGDELLLEIDCDKHILSCTNQRSGNYEHAFNIPAAVRPFFFMQELNQRVEVVFP